MPGRNHSVEVQNLRFEHPQLGAERPKARARKLGQPFVIGIGDDIEQFLDAIAPDRRDDAKLGKMGADRVDYRSLLANEEMGVRWSIRQLCCSGVLVSTNRIVGRLTASQIASASEASFFCRLT